MSNEIWILVATAASIGFIHTVLGPDHYLPFIAMSKARNWTTMRTIVITALCGVGHVASSVIIGAIGIVFGIGVSKLEGIESVRGDWAGWAFLLFGVGYFLWAFWKLKNKKTHTHFHIHGNEVHTHNHLHEHSTSQAFTASHSHEHEKSNVNLTPWILFLVFVLGPCEPLIPILMYPAAQASTIGLVAVTSVFALTTIFTMIGIVLAVSYGFSFVKFEKLEKYTHVIAGVTIILCGVLILSGL
ncbi:MAG: sulfite exporter TauE/SafE family protein [Deltaproteobacteria bacterium]